MTFFGFSWRRILSILALEKPYLAMVGKEARTFDGK
jgi:hypothetical protein